MPKFSVNVKTDVVDFDAGTNIEADSVEELKQAITDFIQSGVIDYVTRAALVAREKGHAAKRGGVQVAPPVAGEQTLEQAVQNVQTAFPEATEIAPPPPIPTPSVPQGVDFEQMPDGKLKVVTPYLKDKSKWREVNDALRAAGARAVSLGKDEHGKTIWANYKTITPDKRDDVVRALAAVL